ncbi:MAG: cytochrome P450 [Gammaproteobacteria bacterium]
MSDLYDPYMPQIMDDPYPIYARLRREQPVYYMERFDAWALALFQDICTASEDTVNYTSVPGTSDRMLLERRQQPFEMINSMDPPAHTQLRGRLFGYFGPRAARALQERIRQWASECLDRHLDRGNIDAVGELSQQVAVRVACAVSGFPIEDAAYLVDLVARTFAREEGVEGNPPSALAAMREAFEYMQDLARRRRAGGNAGEDVVGTMVREVDEQGRPRAPEWIAGHMVIMLIGATETFPKVFASGLLRLWQHPDQRRELCANPALIPAALNEILRYDMPTQWLGRTVARDHEIRGHALRRGQPVIFLYPSGNRDERQFADPDRFDIHRNPARILSFGHGPHRCLGAYHATMEGVVLFEEVLRRFPDYEVLPDRAERWRTEFVQGYSRFPIAFNARG